MNAPIKVGLKPPTDAKHMRLNPSPRLMQRHLAPLLTVLALQAQPATANPAWDVVGIRPGMSETQVMAALSAHRAGAQVHKRTMSFTFSDGVQQINTASFLHEVRVTFDDAQGREDFQIYFAPLPGASRVVGVVRQMQLKSPPTQAQLTSQLGSKYGAPTHSGKSHSTLNHVWGEPGKPMCWRSTPNVTSIGNGDGAGIVGHLQNGQRKGWAPRDLSQCGFAVAASLVNEPVHNLTVRLTDHGAWATTQQQAMAWVEQQRHEAVKARLAKGAAPRL